MISDTARPVEIIVKDPIAEYAVRSVNPFRLNAIRDYAGHQILDAGCGNGAYVERLFSEYDIHGVDMKEFSTWSFEPKRFRQGSVTSLPYRDNSFDTITCFEVLEHVESIEVALSEFRRVARTNVILTVPNCQLPEGMEKSRIAFYHYTDHTHCNFFSLQSFVDVVSNAGFKIVHRALINPTNLLPLMQEAYGGPRMIWKLAERLLRKQPYFSTCLVVGEKL